MMRNCVWARICLLQLHADLSRYIAETAGLLRASADFSQKVSNWRTRDFRQRNQLRAQAVAGTIADILHLFMGS